MIHNTLISTEELSEHINNPNWVVIDCRFSLADASIGAKKYRMGHIPNARYAHLNNDLSSAVTSYSGRHPLPDFNLLSKKLGHWGISNNSQIIVYDDTYGAFASRLWWLLRTMGHEAVAVLDGGIQEWIKQRKQVTTTLPKLKKSTFRAYMSPDSWFTSAQLRDNLTCKKITLIDARSFERYSGQEEPIDPVAGHIPYAINRPFQSNLNEKGLFLDKKILRTQFASLINAKNTVKTVHMCGSGVTACHNLLAMEYAGLTGSILYAGSWSEWIRNANRRIVSYNRTQQ